MLETLQKVFRLYVDRFDFFIDLILQHLYLSGISILIAFMLGGFIGILMTKSKTFSHIALSIVNFLYTIPSIAFFGGLISVTGIGSKTAIIVLSIYALLPMVRNTYTGIENIDANVLQAAEGMGTSAFQMLYKIQLPLALPVILTGLRTMVVMVIATAGIASFVGAGGLGVAIWRGITTYNNALTIAGSLLIACMALLADFLIGRVQKTISKRWLGQ